MEYKPISAHQLSYLTFLLLIGSALVYVPSEAAGQSAWISTILALIPGIFILYVVIRLQSMFPNYRISQISTMVLGKVPGTILNMIFLWSVFLFALSLIHEIAILLKIIYPVMPRTILYPILLLTCIYFLYQGLTVLGRMGEVFIWGSLIFTIIGILIVLPLVNLSNLTPILSGWKPLLAGALYAADWPFDEIVILGFFLPLVSDLNENRKKFYYWYLIGGLMLIILDMEILAILGTELSQLFSFPLFEVFRVAGFGEFRRVEIAFLILWFVTGITAIVLYYQSLNFLIQDIFTLKDYKALIIPIGLCLVVFPLYMFPSEINYQTLGYKYIPIYTFPINLLYPVIILLVAKIRGLPH